ncbi:hypothetical protein PP914_gp240 [Arthrobacter phage Qui]|uniref:Uncharacterized protein n=1 Tax=Arthrobacter phage Qui TaxID=2603260 RepID=A0A5B8WPV8_9CAUD|nr:hypothetical protein PP914_gp240 [Arthrobacter phage Qui]QED11728.1 hypothetical protein SEA_QUI_240 [Arthrobacter phage Qui]QOC56560.1 hypothetical protein SEA_PAELLA_241 [Arthrobacter phage Paella]
MAETLFVRARPKTSADIWPCNEIKRKDGIWVELRDTKIGPFPDKTQAWWYIHMLQDIVDGRMPSSLFAGMYFERNGVWFVERWEGEDGYFASEAAAKAHRQKLFDDWNEAYYPPDYVGIVFQRGLGKFWVDRGLKDDGPFVSREIAQAHKDRLEAEFKKEKV